MTIQEFKKSATVTSHNSTNAWGFAGWVGKIYEQTVNGLKFVYKQGLWHGRHTTSRYTFYQINGVEVDEATFERRLNNTAKYDFPILGKRYSLIMEISENWEERPKKVTKTVEVLFVKDNGEVFFKVLDSPTIYSTSNEQFKTRTNNVG